MTTWRKVLLWRTKMNKFENLFHKTIQVLWVSSLSIVLLLILFSESIRYACKTDFCLSVFVLALLGIVGISIISFITNRIEGRIKFSSPAIIGLVFSFFQIFLLKHYFFSSGWDVAHVIYAARCFAQDNPAITSYFYSYPNNLLLSYIFSLILKLGYFLGFSDYVAYFMLLVFQAGLSYIAGLLTFYTSYKLTGSRGISMAIYIVYLLLICISPWVSVPYSDSMGLIFPIAIIALYCSEPKHNLLSGAKWLSIGMLSYIGYMIKPTIFIVLIAIAIIEMSTISSFSGRKTVLKKLVLVMLGILLAIIPVKLAFSEHDYVLREELRLGPMHFLAMGMNEKQMGIYSLDDVIFSESFETRKERDSADWELAKERIGDMGPVGLIKQFGRKLLTTFNDGSFMWAREGDFFRDIVEKTDPVSRFIRSFYYPDGSRFKLFLTFEHAVWLSVLCCSLLAALSLRSRKSSVIMLALLGFILYSMLFEVRARYIYIFAPLFLVLAGIGLSSIKNLLAVAKGR